MNRKKILSFALGPVSAALLAFVTLPLLTWHYPPEVVGQNNVLNVTLSLCTLIFALGLDQAYVREYHESLNREALFKACYLPSLLAMAAACFALLPFASSLSVVLYASDEAELFYLTVFCVFAAWNNRFLSLILRMEERGLAYSVSQVFPKIVLLGFLFAYYIFEVKPLYVTLIIATACSLSLISMWFFVSARRFLLAAWRAQLSSVQVKGLMRYGLPLIASGLAYWGLQATSTIVLRVEADFYQLAIYAMAMSFAGVATLFQGIFSTLWMPTVYKWVAENENLAQVDRVSYQVLAVIVVLTALAGSLSWVIDFVLPEAFRDVKYILMACMMQPFLYTLSETTVVGLNVVRKTGYTVFVALAAFLVNLFLSFALTAEFGARGAAAANAIAFVCFFVLRTEVAARVWRNFPRMKTYVVVFTLSTLVGLSAVFGRRVENILPWFWCFIFVLSSIYFRAPLFEVLKSMFSRNIR